MIDFKKKMEWYKTNDEGREIATGWDFDVESVADNYAIVLFRDSQVREVIHKDGVATTISADGVIRYSDRKFRNTPPAPCEHRWYGSANRWQCEKCGTVTNEPPVPAPDSVEAAKKLIESLGEEQFHESNNRKRVLLRDLQNFVSALAAEQTAQRKAAGELARLAKIVAVDWGEGADQDGWNALAADASARAGGKNG